MWRPLSSRVTTLRRTRHRLKLLLNPRKSRFEFLDSAKESEQRLVDCVKVMLQVRDGRFDTLKPLIVRIFTGVVWI